MLELLRMMPGEVLGVVKPPFEVQKITLPGDQSVELPFHFEGDTKTDLVVPLPFAVEPGSSVTIEMEFTFTIHAKQGRWGKWRDVTTLPAVFSIRN